MAVSVPFLDALSSPNQALSDLVLEQAAKLGLAPEVLAGIAGAFSGTSGVPNTRVRLTHALSLRFNGRLVAACHQFDPRFRRTVDREYEIDRNATGLPAAHIGQTGEGEATLGRYDLYFALLEETLGTREIITLCDQRKGFTLRETWRGPAGILGGGVRAYEYLDCYFTDIGRTQSATDDRIVKVQASLVWRDRRRVQ